jgi:hypothetical protein
MPVSAPPVQSAKQPAPEPAKKAQTVYQDSYKGLRTWFAAIKPRKNGERETETGRAVPIFLYPAFAVTIGGPEINIGGTTFQARTQKPISLEEEDSGDTWWALSDQKDPGYFFSCPFNQIQRTIARMKDFVVRWGGWNQKKKAFRRASILDLTDRHRSVLPDGVTMVEGVFLNQAKPGDEPLSKYLILLPCERKHPANSLAKWGGRENALRLPSILDVDPEAYPPQLDGLEDLEEPQEDQEEAQPEE